MDESEAVMPDHAPPSIPPYSTTPAPAPLVVSPPSPRPTEFDYSKIPHLAMGKATEKAVFKM